MSIIEGSQRMDGAEGSDRHETTDPEAGDRLGSSGNRRDQGVGVIEISADGRLLSANRRLLQILRSTRDELGARCPKWAGLFEPFLPAHAASGLALGETCETQLVREDGTTATVTLVGIEAPTDATIGRMIVVDRIDELTAVRALNDSSERLGEIEKIAHLGTAVWDLSDDSVRVSAEMCRLFDLPAGRHCFNIREIEQRIHVEDRERGFAAKRTVQGVEGLSDVEVRIVHHDGSIHHMRFRGEVVRSAAGRPLEVFCTVQDITDLRDAQLRSARNERRLAEAQEMASIGSWELEIATGAVSWSDQNYRLYGLDPATTTPSYETFQKMIHPDDRVSVIRRIDEAFASGKPVDCELRVVRNDGAIRIHHQRNQVVFDAAGHPVRFIGTVQDVTDRRSAEETRQRLAAIVESSSEAIIGLSPDGKIESWNAGAETLFGYAMDEAIGRDIAVLLPHRAPEGTKDLWSLVDDGEWIESLELTTADKDGNVLELSLSVWPVHEPSGRMTGLSVIARDVTRRNAAERAVQENTARLQHAQKMEAVGRMAGGVAHDFNNLLTAMLGYTHLASEMLGPESQVRFELEEVRKAGNRAASLTRQLLAFSRRQMLEPQPLLLRTVLVETERMLGRLIGEDIVLSLSLEEGDAHVFADRSQIEQVIVNLTGNARDAMPDGGVLTIGTRRVAIEESRARRLELTTGTYIELAVADTGIGMAPETITHLFEPFFTTKEAGQGSGLGLATVYGIVRQSGGAIEVKSELGCGSQFRILLPLCEPPTAESAFAQAEAPHGGDETVLLVEDEEQVRTVTRRMLEGSGYRVIEASSGRHALRVAQNHDGPIHLMITDIVMPGLNGRELAERIALFRASTRVIYVSGYADDTVVQRAALDTGTPFLHKPFTQDALLRRVRAILDRAA